jgi:hypothetical protein
MDELNLLKSIKAVADTKPGMDFIKWIMSLSKPLNDVFTNSNVTTYALGQQNIGKQIMFKLAEAGCELKIADLFPTTGVHDSRMDKINAELNKLQEKKNNGR